MKAGTKRAGGQRSQVRTIRWSLAMMSREFGPDHKTLNKHLVASGITAGRDGLFSSRDALRLVCGDMDAERLRKMREEADKLELENGVRRGELLDKEAVKSLFEEGCAEQKQKILASGRSDAETDAILNELEQILRSFTGSVETVARRAGGSGGGHIPPAPAAERMAVGGTVSIRRQGR